MRIEAEAEGRALLVISVTPHRYWRARLDGQPVQPRIVNIAYQAIEIPAGRHIIEMEYWNPLVAPALALSVVALIAAMVGVALLSKVEGRNPPEHQTPMTEHRRGRKRR
jgi:uncharacterized membrane protein YfhO